MWTRLFSRSSCTHLCNENTSEQFHSWSHIFRNYCPWDVQYTWSGTELDCLCVCNHDISLKRRIKSWTSSPELSWILYKFNIQVHFFLKFPRMVKTPVDMCPHTQNIHIPLSLITAAARQRGHYWSQWTFHPWQIGPWWIRLTCPPLFDTQWQRRCTVSHIH